MEAGEETSGSSHFNITCSVKMKCNYKQILKNEVSFIPKLKV